MIQAKRKIEWKLINMRNIKNLLGVELLHNLYNQHISRLNAIRFRNTMVVWKNNIARSYAPVDEWSMLSSWVSKRFLVNDKFFLKELETLLMYDKSHLYKVLNHIKKVSLRKQKNISLALLLIDIQHVVFGEIYPVNLVQIEYSLTNAILERLKKYEKKESNRLHIISSLIHSQEKTESVKEEIAFRKIVRLGQKVKSADPYKNKKILQYIKKHHDLFAFMNCAYGEDPRELSFYIEKYKTYYKDYNLHPAQEEHFVTPEIKDHNIKLLCMYMKKVGTFRDINKSLLGQTMRFKYAILDEISRRKLESRNNLNYYLLTEILVLLNTKQKIFKKELQARKKFGVVLKRQEQLEINSIKYTSKKNTQSEFLYGVCASPGIVQGKCKIIFSKEDIYKLNKGDIMVAVGTDFDLMEAIHRAKAVITEEGGLLSHASVVCRELKKPCCINVQDATSILADGLVIKLNATKGFIEIK